ncbi:MAG: hypothetical protein H6740_12465 [Alphaproteobacteria bacterium]|nr:hypothetical protein [Alphaproteobacteria bacterium]
MSLILPTPAEAPFVLRALYTAATHSSGALGERERAMLDAAREILGVKDEVEAPISPEALAEGVRDPQVRRQVVTAMVIISLLDEEGTLEEAELVERFAEALAVSPAELGNLRQIAEGDMLHLQLDVARRVWLLDHLKQKWAQGGLRWLARAVGTKIGLKEDTALAERYRALASFPEDTVGRIYYEHMREQGFPLPGEKGSQVEPVIIHDMMHLLSGYGTDPEGEILTASFSAGNRKREPFTYVFFVLCQFHLGNLQAPFAYKTHGRFDAAAALHALRRGMEVNRDLSAAGPGGWDPWTIFHMTLEEARQSLGVPPA